jgi:glutamate synthase domain-containing protein 3
MVQIDLARTSIREANKLIKKYGARGENIDIVNPDARHHIGVGLIEDITVRVHGSAGYFCAGLSDGPHFEVDGNVGWGVADNMYKGSVVVNGNASAIPGLAIRGAEVVIRGNMGSRAGQVMKSGTLCCAGNATFMAGYMMYGGRIVILGDSGEQVGQNITGGEIYVAGRVQSLGADAELTDVTSEELHSVEEFLDRYQLKFSGVLNKILNGGSGLRYEKTEGRTRPWFFF